EGAVRREIDARLPQGQVRGRRRRDGIEEGPLGRRGEGSEGGDRRLEKERDVLMPGTKEIRMKIRSVQNTRKITKAMEMVAASKMRKAQERMRHSRPYGEKIRNVAAHVVQLGDRPQMDKLIGAVKVMLDGYTQDRFDRLLLFYTRFINTMKQEPVMEQLLPLSGERLGSPASHWDYLYEPEAKVVLEQVLTRYIEAIIFQAVAENMSSEQSARMVAMKSASDNAATLIDELTLIYNKNRQAGITKELSEIVGGAAAVKRGKSLLQKPRH